MLSDLAVIDAQSVSIYTEIKMMKNTWLCVIFSPAHYVDGLVQERRNSSALAMELRLSCTIPLISC